MKHIFDDNSRRVKRANNLFLHPRVKAHTITKQFYFRGDIYKPLLEYWAHTYRFNYCIGSTFTRTIPGTAHTSRHTVQTSWLQHTRTSVWNSRIAGVSGSAYFHLIARCSDWGPTNAGNVEPWHADLAIVWATCVLGSISQPASETRSSSRMLSLLSPLYLRFMVLASWTSLYRGFTFLWC
jgi:hypothetical protein